MLYGSLKKMKKVITKIRRTREQFIHYDEILTNLCLDNGLNFVSFCNVANSRKRWGFTHMNHYICVYNASNETPPGKQFVEDESHDKYMIYKTKMYGNDLNAYGDAIRWKERIIDNDR